MTVEEVIAATSRLAGMLGTRTHRVVHGRVLGGQLMADGCSNERDDAICN